MNNFLSTYPISEFYECVQYIFKKDELNSLEFTAIKIIFSISVNEREFILDELILPPFCNPLISTISPKLEASISKVSQLEDNFIKKQTKLKIDIFFKDNLNQYTWGHTSVTIYPSGISSCPPIITQPLGFKSLNEMYESSYTTGTLLPIFNSENEFSIGENFFELKKASACNLL